MKRDTQTDTNAHTQIIFSIQQHNLDGQQAKDHLQEIPDDRFLKMLVELLFYPEKRITFIYIFSNLNSIKSSNDTS